MFKVVLVSAGLTAKRTPRTVADAAAIRDAQKVRPRSDQSTLRGRLNYSSIEKRQSQIGNSYALAFSE
jgi:hypothetical protein